MTNEEKYKILSDDYTDLMVVYNRNPKLLDRYPDATTHVIDTRYAIAYTPSTILNNRFINRYGYTALPHCYGLTSEASLGTSGVTKLRGIPKLNLRGNGVLVAIIDTGIDYTNPIFMHEDGTSKIATLWDQTIDSENQYPENTFYGTVYNREQINQALSSENTFELVPSIDEIGHGTMLAGVAVGSEVPSSRFSGVVPDSDLIVVKLKQAKPALREFYQIPSDVPCYQENDILWAFNFVMKEFRRLQRPLAICIGFGTSQGPHDGTGPLNNIVAFYADYPGVTISIAAGNEGNRKRHFYSEIDPIIKYSTVELNVGENEFGFSMELWGTQPNTYSVEIISPSGERTGRIVERLNTNREISFIFSNTIINVDYRIIETHTGEQLIFFRFQNPVIGVWKFLVYTRGDMKGAFHMWLPMNGFISNNTYFISSSPYTTITSPSDAFTPISVTAYNPESLTLYQEASRGYSRIGTIKPELTAPGANIIVPTLEQGFAIYNGTGIAAAHTAGITALFLEWGILKEFYPRINSEDIKKFLIRGAKRSKNLQYPNENWGYGIIDIYNVFDVLRSQFPDI